MEARRSRNSPTEGTDSAGYILATSWTKVSYLSRKSFLHLSHKEGKSSSEVKFFCNFLYMAAMDLSTPDKLDFNVFRRSAFDSPTWKGISSGATLFNIKSSIFRANWKRRSN
ncbi:hypothetical protein V8G54_008429 [Vigna mungo]|uniref:Uncharacterized protein n=1 Tax=Vigna mungo TaxID=3915 RepID=A0AAQ3S886_VIGMU